MWNETNKVAKESFAQAVAGAEKLSPSRHCYHSVFADKMARQTIPRTRFRFTERAQSNRIHLIHNRVVCVTVLLCVVLTEDYLLPSARSLHVCMEEQQQSLHEGCSPRTHICSVGFRMHHDLLVRHGMDVKVVLALYHPYVTVKWKKLFIWICHFLKEMYAFALARE